MKTIILLIGLYLIAPLSIIGNPSRWKKTIPAFDSLNNQLDDGYGQDKKECMRLITRMYVIANRHKDLPILRARALYWDARMNTNPDSAFSLLQKATALIDAKQHEYDIHRIQQLRTKFLLDKGEWLSAYIQAKKENKYFLETGDILMLGHTWVHLGIIMSNLENMPLALSYLKKADSCFGQVKRSNLQIKNQLNICNLLFRMGKNQEAIRAFDSLLQKEETRRDTAFYINVLFLGYYDTDVAKVRQYTHKAYELAKISGNDLLLAKASINKASSLYGQHGIDSIRSLYEQALSFARATNNYGILLPSLEGMMNTFSQQSRWDSAFYYSALYWHYNDSISRINSLSEVNRIESRAAIDKYENDLIQMEIKTRLQRKAHIWTVMAIFSLSLLVCSGFWYMRKKEIMKKRLKEAEVKELNVNLENEILKNERYHLEIDSKNRELTSNIIIMQEKNEVLRNLLRQIDVLGSEGDLPRKKSVELKNQIKNHLQTDDEWEYFKLHFESVYPVFFVHLKRLYPTLTENDMRLCAYIRIGMTNKQIAQMLSVLPDSVKISRHRIRKKLLLQQKDSLEDFLRQI